MSVIASMPPPDLAAGVIRALFYGWCTSARFCNPIEDCNLCGLVEDDDRMHYVTFSVARRWALDRFGMGAQPEEREDDTMAPLLVVSRCSIVCFLPSTRVGRETARRARAHGREA